MILVSESSIEKAINKIDSIPDESIQDYIDKIASEQADLISYAINTGNELKLESSENLLYYTFVVLEAFRCDNCVMPEVTNEFIVRTEKDFISNLERMEQSESYEDGMLEVLNTSSQPALLSFIANELLDDSETEDASEEEIAEHGTLFSALQIIIEATNSAINKK